MIIHPHQYMIGYKGYTIHYFNGTYTIAGKPSLAFLGMNAAKAQIDIYEQQYLLSTNQLFENQKTLNEKNTLTEK